jgi:hypothetical protein
MEQPRFEGIDIVYKSRADNKDIRNLLEQLVPKAKAQMIEFSKQFKGRNDKETCKKIFDFLMTLTFIADGEEQVIKLPSALLKKRMGDCKSFSLLTASILENVKIPYTFVYASYNANPIPQHVYVKTQQGCIIDAVYGKFNKEKKPTFKYTKNMNVRYMSGIEDDCCPSLGKTKPQKGKGRQKVKDFGKKVVKGGKTLGLSLGRALFLVMIKKNLDGIASKLSKMNANSIQGYWNKVGGNKTIFMSAIKVGASKPPKKFGFLGKLKKIIGNKKINGIGEVDSSTSGSIISLCVTIGTVIGGVKGAAAGASLGAVMVAVLPMVADIVKQVPKTDIGDEPIEKIDLSSDLVQENTKEEKQDEEKQDEENGGATNKIMKYLPFIAIGGAVLYFVMNKKK